MHAFERSLFPAKLMPIHNAETKAHRPACNQLMEHVCFFRGTRICEAVGNRPGYRTTPPEFGSGGPDGGPPQGLATMLPRNERRLVLLSSFHRNNHMATSPGRRVQGDGRAGQSCEQRQAC